MADRAALLAEAYGRGLLKGDRKALYEEAVRRSLVAAPDHVRALADAETRTRDPAIVEPLRQFARQATLGGSDALEAGLSAVGARLQKGIPLSAGYTAARRVQDEETAERKGLASTAGGVMGGVGSLAFGPRDIKVVGGGALGALGGALSARRLQDVPRGALTGAVVGAGLGGAGQLVARGARAVAAHVARPGVALLAKEGVELTPGQLAGGLGKRAEEAARSTPIAGDAIIAAHSRGQEQFARAAMQRGLTPLGLKIPENVATGHEAIKHVGDVLSAKYQALLPKGGVVADAALKRVGQKVAPLTATMTEDGKAHLGDIVDRLVTQRFKGGKVDGATYQQIQSDLKTTIGRFAKSELPDHGATAEALKLVSSELKDAAGRQNPAFAAELSKVDRGWAHLALAETAAAKVGTESGVFTPKAYAAAVRSANDTVRKRGVARGEALGQDLADAGVKELAQKLPDSGTARRLAGGVLGGAGLVAALAHGGVAGAEHAALAEAAVSGLGAAAAHAAYGQRATTAINQAVRNQIAGAGSKPGALALQRYLGTAAGQAGRLGAPQAPGNANE